MKTNRKEYSKVSWPFLVITLVMLFVSALSQLGAFAQSGRGVPAPTSKPSPTPTPTPTPEAASADRGETKQSLAIDRNGDTYRLVFPTRPDLDNFSEQLNKASAQGYKLTSALYRFQRNSSRPNDIYSVPVAILKLDEVRHEFALFETTSKVVFTITGFEQSYKEPSKRGFRLADYFLISSSCEYRDPDNSAAGQNCVSKHLFLLERTKGVEKPNEFILARSLPPGPFQLKTRLEAELTEQIKDKLAEGFYPSAVFSKWEILLTRAENSDERLTDSPDVQVVTSSLRNDVKKKVNELAKQGYRLVLINKQAAVMYRRGQTTTPLTYTWLKVRDKSFDVQLTRLQESGGIYRMTYTSDQDIKDQLIFEQGLVADGERREYKVLQFDFQIVQDLAPKNSRDSEVQMDLTPSSKETMKQLNQLAKEGFVVRDLFVSEIVSNKVGLLLERSH